MIDILTIEPTVVSKDLSGKYIMIYGQPKIGKTTFASTFNKNLILATEIGYNAISGLKVVPIHKWAECKQILRQLEKPEAREMYDTITIDTVQLLYDLCEKYVCAQNGVAKISDVPWGQGFSQVAKEFESFLRNITLLGYGIILLCHSERRVETIDKSEIEFISPALNKRCLQICNRLVDLIGYIGLEWQSDGTSKRYIFTRQTPTVVAGSRWKYLEPKIDFGYDSLVEAIGKALDQYQKQDNAKIVDEPTIKAQEEILNFDEIRDKVKTLWEENITEETDIDKATEKQRDANKKIQMIFGHPQKLSEVTEDQVELLNLVLLELQDMFS